MPRSRPYTAKGISRVPCAKCGQPSAYQWQICALDNLWHGLCALCDVELNELMLNFVGHPEATTRARAYRQRVFGD